MPLSDETRSKIMKMIQDEMADDLGDQRKKAQRAAQLNQQEGLFYIKLPYLKIPYIKIPYIKIG